MLRMEGRKNLVFSEQEVISFQTETISYLKNLLGKDYTFLGSQKMKEEIIVFGVEEYQKLSSALSDIGWQNKLPKPEDTIGLVRLAAELVAECQNKMSELFDKEKQKLANEATDIVSEKYGVDIKNIIKSGKIVGEAKEPVVEDIRENSEDQPLNKKFLPYAEKKFLVDLYIHGKSLNDLGGMYAYFQEKGWKDNALHRAMASVLHIANIKTSMQFTQQAKFAEITGGALSNLDSIVLQNKKSSPQLGRVETDFNEETGHAEFKAEGMTPSELAHEEIKGLLEYISLDTALPTKGEITDDEAMQLKAFLEKPSFEIIAGVYGPMLSKKIDEALTALIETQDERLQKRIGSLISTPTRDLNKPVSFLRLYKVFTMQSGREIVNSYSEVIQDGKFDESRIVSLEKSETEYRNSL